VPANVASKRTIAARRGAGRAAPLERCTATPPYKNGPGRWSRVTRPTLTPVQWAVNRARRSVSTALRPAGPRVTYWCHGPRSPRRRPRRPRRHAGARLIAGAGRAEATCTGGSARLSITRQRSSMRAPRDELVAFVAERLFGLGRSSRACATPGSTGSWSTAWALCGSGAASTWRRPTSRFPPAEPLCDACPEGWRGLQHGTRRPAAPRLARADRLQLPRAARQRTHRSSPVALHALAARHVGEAAPTHHYRPRYAAQRGPPPISPPAVACFTCPATTNSALSLASCTSARCPELVPHGTARCEQHSRGSDRRWRRYGQTRELVLEGDGHECHAPLLGASACSAAEASKPTTSSRSPAAAPPIRRQSRLHSNNRNPYVAEAVADQPAQRRQPSRVRAMASSLIQVSYPDTSAGRMRLVAATDRLGTACHPALCRVASRVAAAPHGARRSKPASAPIAALPAAREGGQE